MFFLVRPNDIKIVNQLQRFTKRTTVEIAQHLTHHHVMCQFSFKVFTESYFDAEITSELF